MRDVLAVALLFFTLLNQAAGSDSVTIHENYEAAQAVWDARMKEATADPGKFRVDIVQQRQLKEAGLNLGKAEVEEEERKRSAAVQASAADILHLRVSKEKERRNKWRDETKASANADNEQERDIQEQLQELTLAQHRKIHKIQVQHEKQEAEIRSSLNQLRRFNIELMRNDNKIAKNEKAVLEGTKKVAVVQALVSAAEEVQSALHNAVAKVQALQPSLGSSEAGNGTGQVESEKNKERKEEALETKASSVEELSEARLEVAKLTAKLEAAGLVKQRSRLETARDDVRKSLAEGKVLKDTQRMMLDTKKRESTQVMYLANYTHLEAALKTKLSMLKQVEAEQLQLIEKGEKHVSSPGVTKHAD